MKAAPKPEGGGSPETAGTGGSGGARERREREGKGKGAGNLCVGDTWPHGKLAKHAISSSSTQT